MRLNQFKYLFFLLAISSYQTTKAQVDFNKLPNERVASDNTIIWGEQAGPGNAGFANLVRFHPSVPGLVTVCPDMWNIYQSDNNGGQWYSIKDYDGNGDFYHMRELSYSPKDIDFGLAIESSRLWKTEDRGKNWTNITNCPWYNKDANGFDSQGWRKKVAALALDPNNKDIWFVAGGSNVRQQEWLSCYQTITAASPRGLTADNEGKLWRTTNAGASWTLVTNGLDTKAQIGRIIINPKNSQQVFAASNYGVYRSNDGGTNWVSISAGKVDNDIIMDMDFYYNATSNKFSLYIIDQVQYLPNGSTTKCTGGIYKSSDEGTTWVKMNGDLGLDINRLTGGVPANYYKYIATWFGITEVVAKTTYPTLPTAALQCFNMISVDPSRENALYIGFADPQVANSITPGRIWTTNNDGTKWINTARLNSAVWGADKAYWESRGNPYNENMKVGHASPHMQIGSNYALRSTRGIGVGIDGKVIMISDHSTMLSTDYGESWKQVDEDYTPSGAIVGRGNSNLPALTIAQDKRNQTTVLGSGEHNAWIPASDGFDQRIPLKFIPSSQESVNTIAFDPYDVNTLYGTSSRQAFKQNIFRSTDRGLTWANYGVATPATNAWLDDFYTNALTIDPINSDNFYFGITDIVNTTKSTMGGFYYSADHGKTFVQRNNGLPTPCRIRDIKFDPRDNTRASLFVAAEKNAFNQVSPIALGGLYHSANRGQSWTNINPFMMYLAFHAPHDPRQAPQAYKDRYPEADVSLPPSYMWQHPFDNGHLFLRDEELAPWPRTPAVARKHLSDYYAIITHLDDQIGKVIQALKDSGQYDNTLIVFAADSGLAVGNHGLIGKQNIYDEDGIHVPLIFSGNLIKNKGERLDAFAYIHDIFPTICDFAKVPIPTSVDGLSLLPILNKEVKEVRTETYHAYRQFQRAYRKGNYKLIEYVRAKDYSKEEGEFESGSRVTQLFDLKNDPWETQDLSFFPKNRPLIAQMRKEMKAKAIALGDKKENVPGEKFDFWDFY